MLKIIKSDYDSAVRFISKTIETFPNHIKPICIIQNGHITNPGVSDIDLLIGFDDDFIFAKEFILKLNTNKIQGGRIEILNKIAKDINKNQDLNNYPALLFVCTHNSRRSQFAEIWAKTIAFIYNKKREARRPP